MKDRQPGAPGQYKAVITAAELQKLQTGEEFVITMTRDDQPLVEGTPYNKASVLPDDLAARICPNVLDPTPADAYSGLLAIARNAAAVNLLDNSDFRNPVNTNGQTTYNGMCFTIDQWRTWDADSVVTVNDGYLSHTHALYQSIPGADSDKVYTFAVKNTDGVVTIVSGTFANETWSSGIDMQPGDGNPFVRIWGDEHVRNIVWAALYEGEYTLETLPEYQPKGYAVEMLNCNGGAVAMDLLWANASPTSSFAAQTVSLDLTAYSHVMVETMRKTDSVDVVNSMIRKGQTGSVDNYNAYHYYRIARVNNTGVYIGAGYKYVDKETADDTACIPTRIYGIKGVTV